jgi:hypothetical protein
MSIGLKPLGFGTGRMMPPPSVRGALCPFRPGTLKDGCLVVIEGPGGTVLLPNRLTHVPIVLTEMGLRCRD